jgi:hypothetical protein
MCFVKRVCCLTPLVSIVSGLPRRLGMQESKPDNTKHTLLISILTLCCGLILGAVWHRAWIFPFPQLAAVRQGLSQEKRDLTFQRTDSARPAQILQLPVRYLPKYRIESDEEGNKILIKEEGHAVLNVPTDEIALVLVDTRDSPDESTEPGPMRLNQKRLLEKCREHGVTVIYAPNHPVVDKYPQYHRLKAEVDSFVNKYDLVPQHRPSFLLWPSLSNRIWQETQRIRGEGRAPAFVIRPNSERDISRHLTPLSNEYVLCSYMEFRYILFKERISLLLYIGGALNECMLHRETGINILAGIDGQRVPITIVVLEDCSSAMASPDVDSGTAAKVMLDYFKNKIALVANSEDLRFADVRSFNILDFW